jgi:hypothetical protein
MPEGKVEECIFIPQEGLRMNLVFFPAAGTAKYLSTLLIKFNYNGFSRFQGSVRDGGFASALFIRQLGLLNTYYCWNQN